VSAMRKLFLLLLVTAMSGVCASPAGAANAWHTNGPKAFSSTNAGTARWIIHPDSGGSNVTIQCPTSSLSGTLNGPTSSSFPWTTAGTMTPTFGSGANCTVNGVSGYSFVCQPGNFGAYSYSGGSTLATAAGGHISVSGTVNCGLKIAFIICGTFHMPWEITAENPIPALISGAGSLIKKGVQALRGIFRNTATGCAALPEGTVTFGAPSGTGVGDITYVVDGPNAPYMYYGT
jgi:hypothetical protein